MLLAWMLSCNFVKISLFFNVRPFILYFFYNFATLNYKKGNLAFIARVT